MPALPVFKKMSYNLSYFARQQCKYPYRLGNLHWSTHGLNHHTHSLLLTCNYNKKLSYRKQIARQLRIQYVEGIYRPKYYTVALKTRLRVTQSYRKRNHWTDHYTT